MSEYETVKIEREGDGIAWLYMNRPEKMNAMNPTMAREMDLALTELEEDADTGVVILTGAGKAYCAGQDIKESFRDRENVPGQPRRAAHNDWRKHGDWRFDRLYYYTKPTIAMVNGWCCGGAFTHLFSCQLAVAADEAKFAVSEINWGVIPAGIVMKVLAEGLRYRDALYQILVAEPIGGQEAASIGYVNFSVPLAELREATTELAKKVLAKNPATYMACVDAYKAVVGMSFDQSRAYLTAKNHELRAIDSSNGREHAMSEFLDTKSYKPGLAPFPQAPASPAS